MYLRINAPGVRHGQRGQVLAEAVVVMLLLVVLIGALHQTARWQFQWSSRWLKTQAAATAVALEHTQLPGKVSVQSKDPHSWYDWVMRDFRLGQARWYEIQIPGRFAKPAWRMAGAGQASVDRAVIARISQAKQLWGLKAAQSQAVVSTLMPSISAVEMPWASRGSATQWLSQWQGSTPSAYLGWRRP